MERNDPDILVQQFIDGDLSAAELEPALHRIAEDTEARQLLQFEVRMTQDLAATRSSSPPSDFASRTAEALDREARSAPDEAKRGASFQERLRRLWRGVTTPVSVRLRPVSAAIALFLVGVVTWIAWPTLQSERQTIPGVASETQTVQKANASATGETVWIRFMYTDNTADSVAVAGDFNQWDPISLSPHYVNGETVWTGLVPVPRGEHEYQFLINGSQWVADPLAPVKRSDGFGAKNAVLNI